MPFLEEIFMNRDEILNLILELLTDENIKEVNKIIFSDTKTYESKKIIARPISIKNKYFLQLEKFRDNKSFHENFDLQSKKIENIFLDLIDNFSQINIQKKAKEILLAKSKNKFKIKENIIAACQINHEHNQKKNYILEEGSPIDFLVELGIMSEEGRVLKNSYKKFRQINKYLEFIKDVMDELKLNAKQEIKILYFGCGKSYLSFALYYYLKNILHYEKLQLVGLD